MMKFSTALLGFHSIAGILFYSIRVHDVTRLSSSTLSQFYVPFPVPRMYFPWLARGESWPILEPYTTPQPLTQRPCNSHGFIGRVLCEVLLGRQFHPGSWECHSSRWGGCWICSETGAVMLPKKVQEPAVPNLSGILRHNQGCTCSVLCHSHGAREVLVLHEPQQWPGQIFHGSLLTTPQGQPHCPSWGVTRCPGLERQMSPKESRSLP